jgi:hypothetical protein
VVSPIQLITWSITEEITTGKDALLKSSKTAVDEAQVGNDLDYDMDAAAARNTSSDVLLSRQEPSAAMSSGNLNKSVAGSDVPTPLAPLTTNASKSDRSITIQNPERAFPVARMEVSADRFSHSTDEEADVVIAISEYQAALRQRLATKTDDKTWVRADDEVKKGLQKLEKLDQKISDMANMVQSEDWAALKGAMNEAAHLLPHGSTRSRALWMAGEMGKANMGKDWIMMHLGNVFAVFLPWSTAQQVCDEADFTYSERMSWDNLGLSTISPRPCCIPACMSGKCHQVNLVMKGMRLAPAILKGGSGINFVEVHEERTTDDVIAAVARRGMVEDAIVFVHGRRDAPSIILNHATMEGMFGSGFVLEGRSKLRNTFNLPYLPSF